MKLSQIVGQNQAVTMIRHFLKHPESGGWMMHGPTGTGKTSAAIGLALELGVDVPNETFGGFHNIPAGEQTADTIRDLWKTGLRQYTWSGSGWKVVLVNEADCVSKQAEVAWLDILEKLPPRCMIVFTTNNVDNLSQRLLDRCLLVQFVSKMGIDAKRAIESLALAAFATAGLELTAPALSKITRAATIDGQVSYRRAVRAAQQEAMIASVPAETPETEMVTA